MWDVTYEIDANGVEQVTLKFIFLNESCLTENRMRRQDFPTPELPMISVLSVHALSE